MMRLWTGLALAMMLLGAPTSAQEAGAGSLAVSLSPQATLLRDDDELRDLLSSLRQRVTQLLPRLASVQAKALNKEQDAWENTLALQCPNRDCLRLALFRRSQDLVAIEYDLSFPATVQDLGIQHLPAHIAVTKGADLPLCRTVREALEQVRMLGNPEPSASGLARLFMHAQPLPWREAPGERRQKTLDARWAPISWGKDKENGIIMQENIYFNYISQEIVFSYIHGDTKINGNNGSFSFDTRNKKEIFAEITPIDVIILAMSDGIYFIKAERNRLYGTEMWPKIILTPHFFPILVERLDPSGIHEHICTLEVQDQIPVPSAVSDFLKTLSEIVGNCLYCSERSPNCVPSLYARIRVIDHLLAFPTALAGPQQNTAAEWENTAAEWENTGAEWELVRGWASDSLWNWRTYQRLVAAWPAAETAMAAHYQDLFGIPADRAAKLAQRALDFVFVVHFSLDVNSLSRTVPATGARHPLRRHMAGLIPNDQAEAILAGTVSPAEMDAALGPVVAAQIRIADETAVFAAIDQPAILESLIRAGADVNASNGFGKTPLMYAAQFDLPAATRILLGAGADPNRATRQASACWADETPYLDYSHAGGRTALRYALENAGPEVIDAILAAGGQAPDSPSDLRMRMEQNPRLTAAQRDALAVRVGAQ